MEGLRFFVSGSFYSSHTLTKRIAYRTMNNSSEGFYSVERIFELNFMRKRVLSLDLYNPIMFKGKEVFQLCVLKIDEPEERMELLLRRVLQKEGNTDGLLRVKAYIDNPLDCESIVIDNRNIFKIEHLM